MRKYGSILVMEGVQIFGLVDSPLTDSRVPVDSRVLCYWKVSSRAVLASPLKWTRTRESLDSRVPVYNTSPSSQLGSDPTKNVVQCGMAFGPSGYGQIIWDFHRGPWLVTCHDNS